MSAKVTRHGLRWYFDGKQPRCPECNTSNIVSRKKLSDVSAEFYCLACHCEWTQTREESAE